MSLPTVLTNTSAFDAFAAAYDDDFTHSILGQLLRPRVWDILGQHFTTGQHILELTCGTGKDAVWLAQHGVNVTATDGSAEMVKMAKTKAEEQRSRGEEEAGQRGSIEVKQVSLQEISAGQRSAVGGRFDGVFSNFGGLNTIGEWHSLAAALAKIVKPGGTVILVPMGPVCPWEILWYLAHGQPKAAFRRFSRRGVPAKIGGSIIPIWYPSARQLRADFSPWFRHQATESLELWLPPSYLDHLVDKWPAFFARLNQFEKATARLSGGWGDHYIIVLKRN
jgi:SAM-dependent methyltransferase